MTWYGWVQVALFLALFAMAADGGDGDSADGRLAAAVLLGLLLVATLTVGTGTGL